MEKTINDFLDQDYHEYGMYTIENRAIPSVIDGFKPVQRKIIYIANKIWKTGSEKPLKVYQLVGQLAAGACYHHGPVSAEGAVISMAQSFKNSLPLLEELGAFGSLRDPAPGSSRYISTKTNQNFRLLYKDFEILEPRYEDGTPIEPKFFLPIIPTVLLNGSSGIAVGFATNILNRNPLELVDACLAVLDNKKFKPLLPWNAFFKGEVNLLEGKKYQFKGVYKIVNTSTVEVTELPLSMTYEKYEAILDKLEADGKIQSYENNCSDNVSYILKFTRADLAELIKKDGLIKLLKLAETDTENLTCLDERGKLVIFNSHIELIEYFVKFRLSQYTKRKAYLLETLNSQNRILENRIRFIKAIISGELVVNSRQKKTIEADLAAGEYMELEGNYDYLLNMPIHSLTEERLKSLERDLAENSVKIAEITKTAEVDMYKTDLKELRKKISK